MPPDAISLLKADHKLIGALFEEYRTLGVGAMGTRQDVARKICRELTIHARIEEEVFYPRARAVGMEQLSEVLAATEEHTIIKELVAEVGAMSSDDELFDARMQALIEQVEHHVKEEETRLMPQVKRALGSEELAAVGDRLADARSAAAAGHG